MHTKDLSQWRHEHNFSADSGKAEKRTVMVMIFTVVMMVVEIAAGLIFGSMALLADGWHMLTHVAAFGITLFAYRYARRNAENPLFTFGTGKVSALGGFASAVALAVVALVMALESGMRMINPEQIRFNEAILIAAIGLMVNVICGIMLHNHHSHGHDHNHNDHNHDHNLKAAYVHVMADALTSVLAIAALTAGKYLNWIWLDSAMGLVGAAVILRWSYGLLKESSHILLDRSADKKTPVLIKELIEGDADNRVSDLHIWSLGPGHYSAVISLVTHFPKAPEYYKQLLLSDIPHLDHIVVEVNSAQGEPCVNSDRRAEVHG